MFRIKLLQKLLSLLIDSTQPRYVCSNFDGMSACLVTGYVYLLPSITIPLISNYLNYICASALPKPLWFGMVKRASRGQKQTDVVLQFRLSPLAHHMLKVMRTWQLAPSLRPPPHSHWPIAELFCQPNRFICTFLIQLAPTRFDSLWLLSSSCHPYYTPHPSPSSHFSRDWLNLSDPVLYTWS